MICKSKLWIVLFVIILVNGCEKKEKILLQVQTDVFVPENTIITNDVTEHKAVEYKENYYGASVIELIIINRNETSEVKYYDINTEKLDFTLGAGRNIVEIIGLEQFTNLKELWLGATPFIRDYSFLGRLSSLEILVLQNITFSDIDMLYNMNSLRKLIFQSCSINNLKIDALKLPNLEYFEFTNSQLTEFPITVQEKRNIDTINIAYNEIKYIPIEESMNILIVAVGNPISNTDNKNIAMGQGNDLYSLLPDKYRKYVR